MRIRRLTPGDQARLWDLLHVALWDPPPAGLRPREVLEHPEVRIYAEGWGRLDDVGVAAEDERGELMGACWMRVVTEGRGLAHVDDSTPQLGIAVMPSWQRKGVGRAVMGAALEAARTHGFRKVALTVHPRNPAIALYESMGFRHEGLRRTYHLMVRELG
ncbi:MAG TPA: GNAT family N-acetyltransferase [Usitatibacter sp.]|jgi:ribosomal protein S18 acetylase RimI-like enzyme|nr:GNAT family N-acetyltransferase [Usitatibacter sp.]